MTPPQKSPPKLRPVRYFVRGAGFAIAGLGLLYLLAVLGARSAWFQTSIRERARAQLAEMTGARVEIGELVISPWSFQLKIRNLVLHGSEPAEAPPLASIREAVVRISPAALLRRRISLWFLQVTGAQIHLETEADGSTNLPGPLAGVRGHAADSRPAVSIDSLFDLHIRDLVVLESDLWWDNQRLRMDSSAHNVSVLLGLKLGKYQGAFSASELKVALPAAAPGPMSVAAHVEIAKNDLVVDSWAVRSPDLQGDGKAEVHWEPALQAQFSYRLECAATLPARLAARHEIGAGRLTLSGQGSFRGTLETQGRVEARRILLRLPALNPTTLDGSADYALDQKHLGLSRLSASLLGGSVQGSVELAGNPRSPHVGGKLDVRSIDVRRALEAINGGAALLEQFSVSGRANAQLELSSDDYGTSLRAGFAATLEPDPATGGSEPLSGEARGMAWLQGAPAVEFDEATLHMPHSEISAHGHFGSAAANLSITLKTSDFGEWRKAAETFANAPLPVTLDSGATFIGTASGSYENPALTGRLQAGPFEYSGYHWTGLQASVSISPRRLQLKDARLLSAGGALEIDLDASLFGWQITSDSIVHLVAHARETSVEGLLGVLRFPQPLTGQLSGDLTLDKLATGLAAAGTLRMTNGSYFGESIQSLGAEVRVEGGVWKLDQLELQKGHGRITGNASYDPESGALEGHVRGIGFWLSDIERLRGLQPAAETSDPSRGLAGRLEFALDLGGHANSPELHGEADVRGLSASQSVLGDFTSHVDWTNGQAKFDGRLAGTGGDFNFHGHGNTGGDWPIDMSAEYSSLRLDPWLRAFGRSPLSGNLQASGSLTFSGDLKGPNPVHISSDVRRVGVALAELRWQNDQPFHIELSGRHLTVSPFQMQGPSTLFQFRGSADLGPQSALNFMADGQIDSALVHVFDPAILTNGHFDAHLRVQGSIASPTLFGSLHVDHVGLAYPGLPLRLPELVGDVDLQGDRLTIRSLSSASGPATVNITGTVTFGDTPRYNLNAEVNHLRAEYPAEFTSVMSGNVTLSGDDSGGALGGALTVEQMFVPQNFNVLNWVSEMARQAPLPAPAFSSSVSLDLHIGSLPVVSVESRDFTATATVDLNLRGSLSDPVAFGNIHFVNGQAVLRQSTYTLTRGDITLANSQRTDPVLDLEATTRIQRYQLTLRVSGPGDRPIISYRSDPPLSTPNILALLAFGYAEQDQLMASGGRSSLGTQSASALLSQALSSQVSNRITRLFGLSRIAVEPNPSSVGGTRLTVEERLARDFSVTYVTTTGGVYERILQFDWDLTDSMSLLGVRDQNGVYGLELDFRRRFR